MYNGAGDTTMRIENLKTWQWVLLGLLAGAAFSLVLAMAGPTFATAELDTVDASTFEHALLGRVLAPGEQRLVELYHKGQPVLRDVVVHPPFRGDDPPTRRWVTGELYWVGPRYKDPKNPTAGMHYVEQWKPFKYATAAPYTGQNGVRATYPTVSGYLAAMEQLKTTDFAYRSAWQELPVPMWVLPPFAGLLLIGSVWPLSLGVLQRVGLARMPEARQPKAKPATGGFPVGPVPPATPSTAGVRVVPPPSPKPAPVPAGDPKQYGGEFYPVAKNAETK